VTYTHKSHIHQNDLEADRVDPIEDLINDTHVVHITIKGNHTEACQTIDPDSNVHS